jgi:hypothetical protein
MLGTIRNLDKDIRLKVLKEVESVVKVLRQPIMQ